MQSSIKAVATVHNQSHSTAHAQTQQQGDKYLPVFSAWLVMFQIIL